MYSYPNSGWEWQKDSTTSFSPVNSRNVGSSHKNFPTFSFDRFYAIPRDTPKLLNLNQSHPSKVFFLVKPYKIEVMITFLAGMLELHIIKSTI